ncbi:MAG TPA: hypothetical protein VNG71_04340, partial [Pyrinomonadaceae bacterium]|nr:hypothetical protein [Pyrinomonadaceae bacterium]
MLSLFVSFLSLPQHSKEKVDVAAGRTEAVKRMDARTVAARKRSAPKQWQLFETIADTRLYYASVSRVNDEITNVWTKEVSQSGPHTYDIDKWTINCERKQFAIIETAHFENNRNIRWLKFEARWADIEEGKFLDRLRITVCYPRA